MIFYKNKGLNRSTNIGLSNQGAGGAPKRSFFGRLWRSVVETAVGGPIYDLLQELDGDSGFFDKPTVPVLDVNPLISDAENSSIEQFLATHFADKIKILLAKLEKIASIQINALQLKLINDLNNELASVRIFLYYENSGLSSEAQKHRNEFCEEIIFQMEKKIFKAIENSNDNYLAYDYMFKASSDFFKPLKTSKSLTVTATNYKTDKPVKEDNPRVILPIDYTDEIKPQPVATEIATKNKSGINWIFLAIAGFVGYKILK